MTNSQPTSDERDERLRQIRERRTALQLRHGDWPCQTVHNSRERAFQQYVLSDVDFLLSLLDSQALMLQPEYEAAVDNGATAMRDKCVEKVRVYRLRCEQTGVELADKEDESSQRMYWRADGAADALEVVERELQSLTLDQVQEKE